jgi:hypothetical protein
MDRKPYHLYRTLSGVATESLGDFDGYAEMVDAARRLWAAGERRMEYYGPGCHNLITYWLHIEAA